MHTPHDALFCQVFADPRHAEGELQALLPASISELVDWRTLERLPASHKDVAHGDVHADLLFRVEIARRPALLYLLLEHKSSRDAWTPWQLLRYVVRVLEQYRLEHPKAQRLPPIVAMVVYHGREGWRRGTALAELFDLGDASRPPLEPYLPRLQFLVDDLAAVRPEALAARAQTAIAHLALGCLQRVSAGEELGNVLRDLRGVFHAAVTARDAGELLSAVLTYLGKVRDLPREDLHALVRDELGPALEDLMTSTYDQVLNEGLQRGLVQGKAQGKAETLLSLLVRRFGDLPAGTEARVRAAAVEELDRWALRILDADSLDAVFAAR